MPTLTPEAFEAFLAEQRDLSPKAWPRHVWIADDLPSTATNKILKRELVARGVESDGRVLWKRDGTHYCQRRRRYGIARTAYAFRKLAVELA